MSCSTLKEYLIKSVSKKDNKPTHARIGNQTFNIRGGSYLIDYTDNEEFHLFKKLYCKHVFDKKRSEYLTELQDRENGGPILIDLDFKFEKSQTERIIDETIKAMTVSTSSVSGQTSFQAIMTTPSAVSHQAKLLRFSFISSLKIIPA